MRDFTLRIYESLCAEFKNKGYKPITFAAYCGMKRPERYVILRHDVDKNPQNALEMAMLENRLGIKATYYFRIIAESCDRNTITRIAELRHEIGYHYEDLSTARGDGQAAIVSFKRNMALLSQSAPIKTICMHGSPLSRWDNRLLWQHHNYHDFGVLGEPYFDIDFNEVLYLTDTGRSWNKVNGNVRDQVQSRLDYAFKNTSGIMEALEYDNLPDKIMLNVHPQRWHDKYVPWFKELVWQNIKNIGKRILVTR